MSTITVTPFVVPTQDKKYQLYQQIVTIKAAITANTNPAHVAQWRQQLPGLQVQLVDAAMADGSLPAGAILANIGYGAANAGGDNNSSY
jgi:hypothetical protein